MLQRLYKVTPITVYGQLTNLITGDQHFVLDDPANLRGAHLAPSMHLWRVISETAGMIAEDVMAEPHLILIPNGMYEVNYFTRPDILHYAEPTDEWADPALAEIADNDN